MTTEIEGLREALFAQMWIAPLPGYSGDTLVLRGCKMPAEAARPLAVDHHETIFKIP
jgi:hypothetical protein